MKKVVLAYSGGLDTSVCVAWLREERNCEVITFSADLGQGLNRMELEQKALASGAIKVYIKDLQEKFLCEYAFPALKANAVYEGKYLLATALGRPLIAKEAVSVARKEGAQAIAHGCTGKGNDQVRIELSVKALAPDLEVIAPVREWELKSREEEIEYANVRNIVVPVKKESPYSIDRNVWGVSIECGRLEDPWQEPPEEAYQMTVDPQNAKEEQVYLEIGFEQGVPCSLAGEKLLPVELVSRLNEIGGKCGIGRVDLVENRLVGIKSREIYEFPGATILYIAHQELESLVLDREVIHFKELVSHKYAELVYYGLWYSPLKRALDSFVSETQRYITGTVRLKLFRGGCKVVGRKSPYSLYDLKLATYDREDIFDHKAAEGFIKLWGLPLQTEARINKNKRD